MYMRVCVYVCGVFRKGRRTLLELEQQTFVSYHEGARNQIWAQWKR